MRSRALLATSLALGGLFLAACPGPAAAPTPTPTPSASTSDSSSAVATMPSATSSASSGVSSGPPISVCAGRTPCLEVSRTPLQVRTAASPGASREAVTVGLGADAKSSPSLELWSVNRSPDRKQLLLRDARPPVDAEGKPTWTIASGALDASTDDFTLASSRMEPGDKVRTSDRITLKAEKLEVVARSVRSHKKDDKCAYSILSASGRGLDAGVEWRSACPVPKEQRENCEPEHAFVAIPEIATDQSFRDGGWKTADLGRCSAEISAEKAFVLMGKSAAPDLVFRALVSDGVLYLEIMDDVFFEDRSIGDALEIITADRRGSFLECSKDKGFVKPTIKHLKVRLDGFSDDKGIKVEHSSIDPLRRRFAIHFDKPFQAITLAYHDADDRKGVEAILASSKFVAGDASTLGWTRAIAPSVAKCVFDGKKLEPLFSSKTADEPLIEPFSP
ncbi:MAG: hypothetical protein ACHREM_18290 [Polyangiales bacterium]